MTPDGPGRDRGDQAAEVPVPPLPRPEALGRDRRVLHGGRGRGVQRRQVRVRRARRDRRLPAPLDGRRDVPLEPPRAPPRDRATGPRPATGVWALDDVVIEEKWSLTIRGAPSTSDEYVKQDGRWRIRRTGYKRTFEEIQPRKDVAGPAAHRELVGHRRPERAPGGLRAARGVPGTGESPAPKLRAARVRRRRAAPGAEPAAPVPRRRVGAARRPRGHAVAALPRRHLALRARGLARRRARALRRARLRRPRLGADPGAGDLGAPGARPAALHERA